MLLTLNSYSQTNQSDGPVRDDPSVTPLMRAARDGETKRLKSLLKHDVSLNDKDAFGWTALVYAIKRNDLEMVKAIVERGADLSVSDDAGFTALMVAATDGRATIVKYLLDNGADVNARTKYGETVLTISKYSAKDEIAKLVKAAGGVEGQARQMTDFEYKPKADTRPRLLNNPFPRYTREARQNKVSGVVMAQALIGTDGMVKKVRITRGLPDGLSEEALIAVYQMRFSPATKGGQPVEFWMALQVEFNLK
jgi:TonB family protein